MKAKLCWLPLCLVVLALGAIGWSLLCVEGDYLWKVQELNLFLDTPLFFKQQMVVPGGLLTYLGTFFTSFFFNVWQGVVLLCCWWMILIGVSASVFRIPLKWLTLLLIPISLLLISDVQLGYWIYYLKLRGYFFVATIGLTLGLCAVWVYRFLSPRWRPVYIGISVLILYPLLGTYGLFAVLLMCILTWRLHEMSMRCRLISTAVGVISMMVIPYIYYNMVYYQTSEPLLWMAALPIFTMDELYLSFYIPFMLLALFYVLLAAFYQSQPVCQIRKPWLWLVCQLLLMSGVGYGVQRYWYKDYNFHKELAMQRAMEHDDWQTLLTEAADLKDEPTRAIVMMKNLALFRLGRLGDEAYVYPNGAKQVESPITVRLTQVVGRAIYYHYGQLNYCYRWCLEDGVEFGWRAEYLKYMTRCALVNGEYEVARKYIGILKHTHYFREWAEAQEKYLNHRDKLLADAHYGPVFHLLSDDDQLGSDNALLEYYLMTLLLDTHSSDPQMHDLALYAALWTKDIATFWPRFTHYALSHQGQHMPTHYQEAAYLYGHLENHVNISQMPFDDAVVQNYQQFMELAQRCAGMSEEQMKKVFYPRFGKTFYYEYFLVRNQKTF